MDQSFQITCLAFNSWCFLVLKCKASFWVESANTPSLILISYNPNPPKTKSKDKSHLNLLKRIEKERQENKVMWRSFSAWEFQGQTHWLLAYCGWDQLKKYIQGNLNIILSTFLHSVMKPGFWKDIKKKLATEGRRGKSEIIIQAFSLAVFPVTVVQCQNRLRADFKCNSDHSHLWQISSQEVEMVEYPCCRECWHSPQFCEQDPPARRWLIEPSGFAL